MLRSGGSIFFGFYSTVFQSWYILVPAASPEKINVPDAFFSAEKIAIDPAPPLQLFLSF
jgi:hypothetical protein